MKQNFQNRKIAVYNIFFRNEIKSGIFKYLQNFEYSYFYMTTKKFYSNFLLVNKNAYLQRFRVKKNKVSYFIIFFLNHQTQEIN